MGEVGPAGAMSKTKGAAAAVMVRKARWEAAINALDDRNQDLNTAFQT